MNAQKNLLRIGELAREAGVSVTTVKFYVKEGLIRPARKTGRNMAYYDRSCISAIALIRKLQRERYYPLSVIKRLMEAAPVERVELELLDAIHKVDLPDSETPNPEERLPLSEAARRTGLTARQIVRLTECGALAPVREGRRKLYSADDLGVMTLAKRRLDAGIPFEQTVRSFSIYENALREAVRAEVDDFTSGALMSGSVTAEAGARMIRVSDETLDGFIALRRKALNRAFGSRRLEDLERFETALGQAMARVEAALHAAGQEHAMDDCIAVHAGQLTGDRLLDEAAAHFWGFARAGGDIARALAESVRARDYFAALEPSGERAAAFACLKAVWLSLAPAVLGCAEAGRAALEALPEVPASALRAFLAERNKDA